MTLEEKVGQLFVTYAYGQTADTTDAGRRRAQPEGARRRERQGADREVPPRRRHLLRLVEQRGQPAADRRAVQRPAARRDHVRRSGIPLLIRTDQEHGVVTRVGPPATQLPGNMALGAGRSTTDTYDAGADQRQGAAGDRHQPGLRARRRRQRQRAEPGHRRRGRSAPTRRWCRRWSSASVAGYQGANVSATAKHFPGHGDTATDSHYGVPIINHTRAEWERIDAPPFRAAINARHRLDHDRAHRRARARPVRHAGDAVEADHHRHPARRAGLRRRGHHRRADHAGRPRRLRRRPHPGAGAEGRRRPAADARAGQARHRLQRRARRRPLR